MSVEVYGAGNKTPQVEKLLIQGINISWGKSVTLAPLVSWVLVTADVNPRSFTWADSASESN